MVNRIERTLGEGNECTLHILQTRRSSKAKVKAIFSAANFYFHSITCTTAKHCLNANCRQPTRVGALRTISARLQKQETLFLTALYAAPQSIQFLCTMHVHTFRTRMKITYNFTRILFTENLFGLGSCKLQDIEQIFLDHNNSTLFPAQ